MQTVAPTSASHVSDACVALNPQSYKQPVKSWSTIPSEIIALILHMFDDDMTKMLATHVCRNWREAALGCPTLWTTVHLTGGAAATHRAQNFAARAAPLPVDLFDCYTATPVHLHPAWLELIAGVFPRVRSIRAYCTIAEEDIPTLRHILDLPAPVLESFVLSLEQETAHSPLSAVGLGQAPRLTQFNLSGRNNLPIPWKARWYMNQLTYLTLAVDHTETYGQHLEPQIHDVEEVLDCLESLKGTLQYLRLHHISVRVPEEHTCRRVELPRLSSLYMAGATSDLVNLRSHLDFNKGTFVDLRPQIFHGDSYSLPALFPVAARNLPPITSLHCIGSKDHFRMWAYCEATPHALVQVHIQGDSHVIPFSLAMMSMCKFLPDRRLPALEARNIPTSYMWSAETWTVILFGVQGLEIIITDGDAAAALCEALGVWRSSDRRWFTFPSLAAMVKDSKASPDPASREYFLSDLKKLVLLGIEDLPEWFLQCLQDRAEAGHPLKSIQVTMYEEENIIKWRGLLRQVVEEVGVFQCIREEVDMPQSEDGNM
ncbi:hypothetical protein FA95DRAFT_304223 [Auriscalpium vulgare]|uniref:Uncharacterized protein n=1 Tax=Auriscalpium vulgare TaxID=40419 RepID=A0ACB8RIJ2_9AGAM|nr:hypothetical protein FA95DRAFT_304223 [Auriscalpium vulgare]